MSNPGGPDIYAPLSPTEVLARIKRVDGQGSGLDADLVRGREVQTDKPTFIKRLAFQPAQVAAGSLSYILRY